jgi:hypothetical protein
MSVHSVEMSVSAHPEVLFDLLSDIPRMAEWSPEVIRCRWIRGATGPQPGACFRGWSRNGWRRWSTLSRVRAAERPRLFEWRVTFIGRPVATWRYAIDAISPGASRLMETVIDERGPLLRRISPLITGSSDRQSRNDETMNETLQRLKAAAEAAPRTKSSD